MPDADGRIRPVVSPGVPWCMACKLVACACESDDAKVRRALERRARPTC